MTGQRPDTAGTTLVIGYGNSLRSDDGAGPRVAAAVASWDVPGLVAVAVHQLTPELAERLAFADLAIFVDARLASGAESVEVYPLETPAEVGIHGHVCDPRSLLALARAIYGRSPRCWLVTVPSTDFSLGEGLSKTARAAWSKPSNRSPALPASGASLRRNRAQLLERQRPNITLSSVSLHSSCSLVATASLGYHAFRGSSGPGKRPGLAFRFSRRFRVALAVLDQCQSCLAERTGRLRPVAPKIRWRSVRNRDYSVRCPRRFARFGGRFRTFRRNWPKTTLMGSFVWCACLIFSFRDLGRSVRSGRIVCRPLVKT